MESSCKKKNECSLGHGYSLNRSLFKLKSIVGNVRTRFIQALENATVIAVQKQQPRGLI